MFTDEWYSSRRFIIIIIIIIFNLGYNFSQEKTLKKNDFKKNNLTKQNWSQNHVS